MVVTGAQPVQRQLVKFEAKGVLQIEPEAVQRITLGRGGPAGRAGAQRRRLGAGARRRGRRAPRRRIWIPRSRCCTARHRSARSPRRSCRASTRVRLASKSRSIVATLSGPGGQVPDGALRRPQSGGLPAIHADRWRSQGLPDVALHRRRMDGGVGGLEGAMTWAKGLGCSRRPVVARFRRRRRTPGRDHRSRHGVGRRAVGALRALLAGRGAWAMPRETCANSRPRLRVTSRSKPTARLAPAFRQRRGRHRPGAPASRSWCSMPVRRPYALSRSATASTPCSASIITRSPTSNGRAAPSRWYSKRGSARRALP